MARPTDEIRAKDLLKDKAIPERALLCQGTVDWLVRRLYWRPAGCSARLFEGMNTEDPFAPPPDYVPPEPRPLYVAERFARIDNAVKPSGPKLPAGGQKQVPEWMERMRALREANEARKAEGLAREKARAKAPSQVHTPTFGAATDPLSPEDRRPPRVAPPEAPRATDAGRFRARPQRSTAPRVTGEDGEPLDRTPPRIVPESGPTSKRPRAAPVVSKPAADGVDRTPPKVRHVVTDERGEPLKAWRERRAAKKGGGPLGGVGEDPRPVRRKVVVGGEPPGGRPPMPNAPTPPAPEAKAEASAPDSTQSPRTLPSSGGGLDDLFGGAQEGRVRVGRREKKQVVATPEEASAGPAPGEAIDRRPPIFRNAVPTADGGAAVPEPEPEPEPEAPPAPVAAKAPPTPAPPSRRPPSTGGMDDLFGGAQEGRVRVGRRVKKDVVATPEEGPTAEAPADTVDRRPPIFRNAVPTSDGSAVIVPPEPEPEPEPEPTPPPPPPGNQGSLDDLFAPSPPRRAAPTGSLDDLFGAPSEGRVKVGRRVKKDVVAVPEERPAKEEAEEAIDRTPPKIADVDPSKLPK